MKLKNLFTLSKIEGPKTCPESHRRIKDLPKICRPREKLIAKGPQNLKDEELLAILLGTGREGKNVIEVAKQILNKYSKKRLLKIEFQR